MPYQNIGLRQEGGIAVVTLNRPEAFNCINEALAAEIREVCEALNQDDQIRVVVVTGEGEAFCRGNDSPVATADDPERAALLDRLRVADAIGGLQQPAICALNGDAVAQGLELALACDLRIAEDGAAFGLTQVSKGLIPWDGGTQRLPRLVGSARALEMVLASRVVEAQEALTIGLVNEVVEKGQALERSLEAASMIAAYGPIAVRYAKETVHKGLDMTLEQGLRLEADLNIILQSTQDRAEGIRSFLEKRPPKYEGR